MNKCSDKSMEVTIPVLLGNNDRQINRPTNQPTDGQTDFQKLVWKYQKENSFCSYLQNEFFKYSINSN